MQYLIVMKNASNDSTLYFVKTLTSQTTKLVEKFSLVDIL